MGLGINRRHRGLLGSIKRVDGGGVVVDFASDVEPEEIAALMVSISDFCEANGWHPGQIAKGISDIHLARKGIFPAMQARG
jgi:hypothetical protein